MACVRCCCCPASGHSPSIEGSQGRRRSIFTGCLIDHLQIGGASGRLRSVGRDGFNSTGGGHFPLGLSIELPSVHSNKASTGVGVDAALLFRSQADPPSRSLAATWLTYTLDPLRKIHRTNISGRRRSATHLSPRTEPPPFRRNLSPCSAGRAPDAGRSRGPRFDRGGWGLPRRPIGTSAVRGAGSPSKLFGGTGNPVTVGDLWLTWLSDSLR